MVSKSKFVQKDVKGQKPTSLSTYIPRIRQLSVPSSELKPPSPLPQANVFLPPNQRGKDTLAYGWGGGGPNSDDWNSTLSILWHTYSKCQKRKKKEDRIEIIEKSGQAKIWKLAWEDWRVILKNITLCQVKGISQDSTNAYRGAA